MYTLATQLVSLYKLYFPAVNNEEGQGMVEYALIIALVAIGLVVGLGLLQGGIGDSFDAIITALGGGEAPE